MSRATISPIQIEKHSAFTSEILNTNLFTAVDPTDGAEVTLNHHDERTVIIVQNTATASGTVTLKAGNGIQGVCDEVCTIAASSTVLIVPESGRFKVVSGADKGKLIISASANTIKVAVIQLP